MFVSCFVLFLFNIFFDVCIHFFYHIFNAWRSLFHLSCSVGEECLVVTVQIPKILISSIPLVWVFFINCISNFRSWIVLCLYTACVFLDISKGIIHFLLRDIYHIHKWCLKSFSYASAVLEKSGPFVVGSPRSIEDILSWLLLIVLLHGYLSICVWDD